MSMGHGMDAVIDTLALAERLERDMVTIPSGRVGMPDFGDMTEAGNLATKQDVEELRADVQHEISGLRADLQHEIGGLRAAVQHETADFVASCSIEH